MPAHPPRAVRARFGARATCAMHRSVRIDRRKWALGWPALPRHLRRRTVVRGDGRTLRRGRAARRVPRPRPGFHRGVPTDETVESTAPRDARTQVLFPTAGALFVYDEGASSRQAVTLRAAAPGEAKVVRFFVDGKWIASRESPFVADWPLTRGAHVVRTESDIGAPSQEVPFSVQ